MTRKTRSCSGVARELGRQRFFVVLGLCLLASLASSGCLRDEVFPEPYAWREGPAVTGEGDHTRSIQVPEGARRVRFVYEATVAGAPVLGNPQGVTLLIRDPHARVHSYNLTASGATRDLFGGDVAGTWTLVHSDPFGGSRFVARFDFYMPRYDDWSWWQVWRA